MGESKISAIQLVNSKDQYSIDENVEIRVQFSIEGDLRDNFNEKIGQRHTTIMMFHLN